MSKAFRPLKAIWAKCLDCSGGSLSEAQSGIIKGHISGIFSGNKSLRAMVKQQTRETIELKNDINISVKTSNFWTVRGFTIVCAILEEIAFLRSGEPANPRTHLLL
jgi:hypothetical protein